MSIGEQLDVCCISGHYILLAQMAVAKMDLKEVRLGKVRLG